MSKKFNGRPTIVVTLPDGETERYNIENYKPPDDALEDFVRVLLPDIQEFFSKTENIEKLEQWKRE